MKMNEGAEEISKRKKRKLKFKERQKISTAETRARFYDIVEQFRLSEDEVYEFQGDLNCKERGAVHNLCQELGLRSRSSGLGKDRRIMISKVKIPKTENSETKISNTKVSKTKISGAKKVSVKDRKTKSVPVKKEKLNPFTFSEQSKADLHDLFSQYPPNDADMSESKVGESSVKNHKAQKLSDDTFRKPAMTQSEIANKVVSLSSRIKNDPSLRQITEKRSKLPIASFKDVITSTMESHQVMLICGETGCGKTTQVPQFILDHSWSKGEACKVVCSQPRRISATSVAERIASERGEALGDSVGYKIRLDAKGGRHSSLVFCTNGILLRVLVGATSGRSNMPSKETAKGDLDITHIIVDEIHERDRYSDIMLTIFRDILPLYPHLRLILMSATIDAEQFSTYFGDCPIIQVPGFTYPVKSFYLEDVLSLVKLGPTKNSKPEPSKSDVTMKSTFLTDGCLTALDEAIDLALSNDDFDPLLELISSEGTAEVFNYQHSKTRETPLMAFAGKGRVSDICMLLSLGVDCRLQSHAGKTAYDYAKQHNHVEAAKIIKKRMKKEATMKSNEEDKKLRDEEQKLLDEEQKLVLDKEQKLLDEYLLNVNPDLVDCVLIEQLLRRICMDSEEGAILVFLPGWDEINRTRDKLLASPFFKDSSKFDVIPLHSRVPLADQQKAFIRPKSGCRKIILSTNIAETSVTIEDVVYVIDSGRMKENNYDPYCNVTTLESSWISKANAKQREGRAGRCQPGICYHLFSKLRWASLPNFQVPEIKRMPLEELCLQVKIIDPSCKIEEFMKKTMDPPVQKTINNALLVLQNVGALTPDEKLTELGEKLGTLPVHPLTSKMLFLAILMNCLDPALTLACASNNRSPFIQPMQPDEKKLAQAAKLELASFYGGNGDQLAVVAAFDFWRIAKEKGVASMFCTKYFVAPNNMRMLSLMREKLKAELQRHGFLPKDTSQCSLNARIPGILHAVLFSGLYPMVGRMIPMGPRSLAETVDLNKVRLHASSANTSLSFKRFKLPPLIIFDEITRGDWGMSIRECCLIGFLPLLLLAAEIVVTPVSENDNNKSEYEGVDCSDKDKKGVDDLSDSKNQGEKIMVSPSNVVKVVVDRWLPFELTALDIAQIYCLRERLAAAIVFKMKHPRNVLPKHLDDSLYAIACILSNDGMLGIAQLNENQPVDSVVSGTGPVDSLATMVSATKPVEPLHQNDLNSENKSVDKSGGKEKSSKKRRRVDSPATMVSVTEPVESLATDIGQVNQSGAKQKKTSKKKRRLEPVDSPATVVSVTEPVGSLATTVSDVSQSAAKQKSSKKKRRGIGPVDSPALKPPVDSVATTAIATDIDHGKAVEVTPK